MLIATRPSTHPLRRLYRLIPHLLGNALVCACFGSAAWAGPFLDAGHAPSAIVAWATEVEEVIRGPIDVDAPELGLASLGDGENALGASTGNTGDTVSLGDGGSIILYFESGIGNGDSDDFAVFENGFADLSGLFAELAYVEVSSDGVVFARFDSDAQNSDLVESFDTLDPSDYHGLAGRHAAGIGTGFDLAHLALDPRVLDGSIDLYDIRFVRVIDVIGDGSTADGGGNPIHDPYPTPFAAGGFDLEAIGAIYVPEPKLANGLFAGLIALSLGFQRTMRRRSSRSVVREAIAGACLITLAAMPAAALTSTFEDLGLGVDDFENGAGLSGGYTSGGVYYENNYSSDFGGFFDGFAASTMTDATTPGFGNQFSNITGSGAGGSGAFGIFFNSLASIVLPTPGVVLGAEFTNTTYAFLSLRDGDDFAAAFGGTDGNAEDFFRLIIEGIDDFGASTGFAELMLADYRSADNSLDFILDEWTFLDLSRLGVVRKLQFSFESSDVGAFGINTPQYFAIDNLVAIPEPSVGLFLGLGLVALSRRSKGTRDSDR